MPKKINKMHKKRVFRKRKTLLDDHRSPECAKTLIMMAQFGNCFKKIRLHFLSVHQKMR